MEVKPKRLESIGPGIVSLQVATDEDPYLGAWLVPVLTNAVEEIKADQAIHAVVLVGGTRYFSAGASRNALLEDGTQTTVPSYTTALPLILLSIPVPTIAAMSGHAVGGGLALGLWCDMVVLAEESLYGLNFMALGFTPGMGSTTLVEETIGGPLAREMLFSGRLMKGRELKAIGGSIAHAVLPRAQVYSHAVAIAEELVQVPRQALALLKGTLSAKRSAMLERAIKVEQAMHAILFADEETRLRIAESYAVPGSLMQEGRP